MAPSVSSLYIYPIKSCRGISLSQAVLSPTGFAWDRQWMLVNENGRFLTQRQEPRLALVEPALPPEALQPGWGSLGPEAALVLRAPGMAPLQVPLRVPREKRRFADVAVWQWAGQALDEGSDAAHWFSAYLGRECRLVRFDSEGALRPTNDAFAEGFQTAFADGYPYLLISEASLAALSARLPEPLPLNRFRPNIFVTGCEPFEEDTWQQFSIGEETGRVFRSVKPCSRCKITTTNQETAEVGREPLQALAKFRLGGALQLPAGMQREVYFGMNVVCQMAANDRPVESSLVSVDDIVHVVKKASSLSALLAT